MFFGNGNDGSLTVNALNTVINDYTYLTGDEAAEDTVIAVNDAAAFSVGDEILIIQMQDGSEAAEAGDYEFRTITEKDGNNLTVAALSNNYNYNTPNTFNSTIAQVVRVPQYTDVTVNVGASIIASAWNGYIGGIVVFRATGEVIVNGSISVVGKGYRRGEAPGAGRDYSKGKAGERTVGRSISNDTTCAAKLEGGGGPAAGADASGGGGGYGTAGANGGPGSISDYGRGAPAFGIEDLSFIYFGGGGGSSGSHSGGRNGVAGGAAGGIIIIAAFTLTNNAIILAGGNKGVNGVNGGGYIGGGGGGGAGGSILISYVDITEGTITAIGGKGGTKGVGGGGSKGGDGGNGRISLVPISVCIVTPDTLTLALTQHAPTIRVDCTVTPATQALVLTQHALMVGPFITVTPVTQALALTQHTPTIRIDCTVTPAMQALALVLQTPVVGTFTTVYPATFELALTQHAPEIDIIWEAIPAVIQKDLIDPYSGGAWLWLAEIVVPNFTTQRIARNTANIHYARNDFEKANLKIGKQAFAGDGSIPRIVLQVAQDLDGVIEDIINDSEGCHEGTVKLIRVNEKFLDYEVEALEANYSVLVAESNTEWVTFILGIPNPLTQRIPLRIGSSKMCPWALPELFKGVECQYVGPDISCTGTIEDCHINKNNAVHWGGELGLDPNVTRV